MCCGTRKLLKLANFKAAFHFSGLLLSFLNSCHSRCVPVSAEAPQHQSSFDGSLSPSGFLYSSFQICSLSLLLQLASSSYTHGEHFSNCFLTCETLTPGFNLPSSSFFFFNFLLQPFTKSSLTFECNYRYQFKTWQTV